MIKKIGWETSGIMVSLGVIIGSVITLIHMLCMRYGENYCTILKPIDAGYLFLLAKGVPCESGLYYFAYNIIITTSVIVLGYLLIRKINEARH